MLTLHFHPTSLPTPQTRRMKLPRTNQPCFVASVYREEALRCCRGRSVLDGAPTTFTAQNMPPSRHLYCLTVGVGFSPSTSVVYLAVCGYVLHVVATLLFASLLWSMPAVDKMLSERFIPDSAISPGIYPPLKGRAEPVTVPLPPTATFFDCGVACRTRRQNPTPALDLYLHRAHCQRTSPGKGRLSFCQDPRRYACTCKKLRFA